MLLLLLNCAWSSLRRGLTSQQSTWRPQILFVVLGNIEGEPDSSRAVVMIHLIWLQAHPLPQFHLSNGQQLACFVGHWGDVAFQLCHKCPSFPELNQNPKGNTGQAWHYLSGSVCPLPNQSLLLSSLGLSFQSFLPFVDRVATSPLPATVCQHRWNPNPPSTAEPQPTEPNSCAVCAIIPCLSFPRPLPMHPAYTPSLALS